MNLLKKYEEQQIKKLTQGKDEIPNFKAGDNIAVSIKISDGNNQRFQLFEGLVIARRSRGLHSSVKVRKVSQGEGVEKTFCIYSPNIQSIKVVKRGVVRRAKLYYIRKLKGKAARIKEMYYSKDQNK